MNDVLLGNQFIQSREEAVTDIEDRGYQFGDGVYEVIRVYQGKVFTFDEHMARFERSAKEIRLTFPYPVEELKAKLLELVERNKLATGMIYLQMSRGVAPRYHGFPTPPVAAQIVAYTKVMERPVESLTNGVVAHLVEDIRWLRCDIKSINLLPNVLAKQEAADHGAFEAIQHRGDIVTEGSSSNLFIVQEGKLYTHPATSLILNGITRIKVLELAHQLQLQVEEKSFTVKELLAADEAFITSTTSEVMPVIKIGEQTVGAGIPGPITVKLQQAFKEILPLAVTN